MLKIISDRDSRTGSAAAILLRNIRPRRIKSGDYQLASSEFMANFFLNCDGFKVRPKVMVSVVCQLNGEQQKQARTKRLREAALRGSPILK